MQQPLFLIKNRNLIRIFSNLISIVIFIKWRPQLGSFLMW